MMALVMAESIDEEHIRKTEIAIRLFLNAYDKVESTLRKEDKDIPGVLTTYNFVCLLNVPK